MPQEDLSIAQSALTDRVKIYSMWFKPVFMKLIKIL